MPRAPLLIQVVLFTFFCSYAQCLRCWVCGQDASPHDSNPYPKAQTAKRGKSSNPAGNELRSSWCSTSISNASCTPDFYAQEVQCYKELWTVDGKEMIKRGCAQKDARYTRTGCEEQITGAVCRGHSFLADEKTDVVSAFLDFSYSTYIMVATLRWKLSWLTTCGFILAWIPSALGNSFSPFVPIITDAQCFGRTVFTVTSETTESEFDICIGALVAGVIIFISVYPFIGLLEQDRRRKRSVDFSRKHPSVPFPFGEIELPNDLSVGKQFLSDSVHSNLQGSQFQKKASIDERFH
eukprot:TCALIF_03620-PA protein Name:"Protein of unknown function" AED:0.40 eAED:0.40 QI:0/0.33/0/0.5/0.66/0.5/4/0/294